MDKKLTPYMIAQIKKILKDAASTREEYVISQIMRILGLDPCEDKR